MLRPTHAAPLPSARSPSPTPPSRTRSRSPAPSSRPGGSAGTPDTDSFPSSNRAAGRCPSRSLAAPAGTAACPQPSSERSRARWTSVGSARYAQRAPTGMRRIIEELKR